MVCTICFENVLPVEVRCPALTVSFLGNSPFPVTSPQAIHVCANEHTFHARCFNTLGAERSRHCVKYQLEFRVLCPVCKCDETNRFEIDVDACASLLSSEITTSLDELSTGSMDTTFTETVAAMLARRPFCAVCKGVVDYDQPFQRCSLCDRRFHSALCYHREVSEVTVLGLHNVTQGTFAMLDRPFDVTHPFDPPSTPLQVSRASTALRRNRTRRERSLRRSNSAGSTCNGV